jgi:hypothetical protein
MKQAGSTTTRIRGIVSLGTLVLAALTSLPVHHPNASLGPLAVTMTRNPAARFGVLALTKGGAPSSMYIPLTVTKTRTPAARCAAMARPKDGAPDFSFGALALTKSGTPGASFGWLAVTRTAARTPASIPWS